MADAALCPARFDKTGRCQACWTFAYADVSGRAMFASMPLVCASAWHAAGPKPVDSSILITGLLLCHKCVCKQLCPSSRGHPLRLGI
jgi:hypothetical protein